MLVIVEFIGMRLGMYHLSRSLTAQYQTTCTNTEGKLVRAEKDMTNVNNYGAIVSITISVHVMHRVMH